MLENLIRRHSLQSRLEILALSCYKGHFCPTCFRNLLWKISLAMFFVGRISKSKAQGIKTNHSIKCYRCERLSYPPVNEKNRIAYRRLGAKKNPINFNKYGTYASDLKILMFCRNLEKSNAIGKNLVMMLANSVMGSVKEMQHFFQSGGDAHVFSVCYSKLKRKRN